jgi:hypothetical protein
LKLLLAEVMLDKQMLQDVAKKSGDADPATRSGGLFGRDVWHFATTCQSFAGAIPFNAPLSSSAAFGGGCVNSSDPAIGQATSALRL